MFLDFVGAGEGGRNCDDNAKPAEKIAVDTSSQMPVLCWMLSAIGTSQWALMLCGWKGNRISGSPLMCSKPLSLSILTAILQVNLG